ncbi:MULTISPECIES: DUF6665 family protein [Nitratireductor]|uniref:DUF6665 family protein n=2 Tax=Phyllobacteriaceae TaxID=69277 RepID=UPI0019D38238|nr:hypothetical protein [Nitratireductor aquibiodomus]MBN7775009.1 hypothetical protein [Nitratireductor pacificus]MBN7779870.1 hypothetical protein [Nitratireductor pacificus]MBN7788677.1 hypothetical protein [Nitratireductor aquimarinus]MBY6097396.1 hypothetical protein [Nitratireductor aquimarinus]
MLKMPSSITGLVSHPLSGDTVLQHEIAAEQASSLGHAGRRVEKALARLSEADESDAEARDRLLHAAADAVHGYFIQRELCGMRRHDDVIKDMAIPGRVLARLGAT